MASFSPPPDRPGHSMPEQDWPERDRSAWSDACRKGELFEEDGLAAHLAPATLKMMVQGYGAWLFGLKQCGWLDGEPDPGARITRPRIASNIGDMKARGCSGYSIPGYIWQIYSFAKLTDPGRDWSWLKQICNRLWQSAVPKKDKRLHIVATRCLVEMGIALMTEADRQMQAARADDPVELRRCAMKFRDGLKTTLLAMRPLRVTNFASIEIDRHLVWGSKNYRLVFAAKEMKNKEAFEIPFPETLVSYLERYLAAYRPILLQGSGGTQNDTKRLWISGRGSPMSGDAIHDRITNITQKRLGRPINPHLFRDCAATSIAEEDPENVHIITVILGHSSFKTGQKHYNHAQYIKAARRHSTVIEACFTAADELEASQHQAACMSCPAPDTDERPQPIPCGPAIPQL